MICGFVAAGDGTMMLLLTSVFIMTFTALTGTAGYFVTIGAPDLWCLVFCVLSTLLWARIAAKFANKASPVILNRATDAVRSLLGIVMSAVNYL